MTTSCSETEHLRWSSLVSDNSNNLPACAQIKIPLFSDQCYSNTLTRKKLECDSNMIEQFKNRYFPMTSSFNLIFLFYHVCFSILFCQWLQTKGNTSQNSIFALSETALSQHNINKIMHLFDKYKTTLTFMLTWRN